MNFLLGTECMPGRVWLSWSRWKGRVLPLCPCSSLMSFACFCLPAPTLSKLVVGSHVTEGWCTLPEWWAARPQESQPMCCVARCRKSSLGHLGPYGPTSCIFVLCHQSLQRFELWQSAAQSTMKDENTLSEQGWFIRKQKVHTFFVFVCFVAAGQRSEGWHILLNMLNTYLFIDDLSELEYVRIVQLM